MKFIFIGGCGRSGTTLVQKIFTSHSIIGGGPEFDFSGDIAMLFRKMNSKDKLDRLSYFYDEKTVKKNFQNFYSSFFMGIRKENPGLKWISEKTPANINCGYILLELFPDAVFVNVIRDGRDVFVSHKEVAARYSEKKIDFNKKGFSIFRISALWNSALYQYSKLKESQFGNRVVNIYYEKLLQDTEAEIRRVCLEIGIEFEQDMISSNYINKEFDQKFVADGVWYTNEKLNQDFNLSKIGRWKRELTRNEKKYLALLMNDNLIRFGYEVENYSSLDILKTKLINKFKLYR